MAVSEIIKKPGAVEKISETEAKRRASEIVKCINDPVYFCRNYYYIRSIDKGTILLPLYKKQEELIKSIAENRFVVSLAARQSGKTTAYAGIALWICFFLEGKEIIIVANKEKTAIGILKRIKSAYEWIPKDKAWIKPGVKKWSEKQVEFENGCSITAMASSADAARSGSAFLLIIDEAHFIPRNIVSELWSSVYPVVSRSETSKVCMVSTANGVGGLFYDVWMDATIGGNKKWYPVLINWWDIEGRDEKWKQEQIKGFGPGGEAKFAQEFGNEFLGSSPTLLDNASLKKLADAKMNSNNEYRKWRIGNQKAGEFDIFIYKEPIKTHSYVLGGDVSEGIGLDYSIAKVFDITDPFNVEEVASFESNLIPGVFFGYVMTKLGRKYNDAYVACERNGVSATAIDALWRTFEYENIVDVGSNKYAVGIFSNHSTKLDACIHFRNLVKDPDFNLVLHDGKTILELQKFEKLKAKSTTTYEASTGHDDKVMALIWAMYVLKTEIVENYYSVSSYRKNMFGIEVPARLITDLSMNIDGYFTTQDEFEFERKNLETSADKKLKLLGNSDQNEEKSENESIDYDFSFNDADIENDDHTF